MITIHLEGRAEKIAAENRWQMRHRPLYHQWRTVTALQQDNTDLVMNSYDTGCGKTLASLLYLFELHETGTPQDVLFVAPTNALLAQHEADIREFVTHHKLDFFVQRITAAENRKLRQQLLDEGDYKTLRPGETLNRILANYREVARHETKRKGLILIVNPDIFYYAMMLQYGPHDQKNLFSKFLDNFRYIVIDEFHYYDQKQLAFFLFFFGICQELGYFTHAHRKICLLSATPNGPVQSYLDQLFGPRWTLISPDNEPADSQNLATIPTLSPLTLTIKTGELSDQKKELESWLSQQKDGVIISDSLQRINELHSELKPLWGENIQRITGPESENARQKATAAPLILATPTVDIGYNFVKMGKKRQNIDFLICEARYRDDLRQRIGRAGRILGKPEQQQPSQAIVLVSDDTLAQLRPHDGQTLSRSAFGQQLDQIDPVPAKHNLFRYISSHAITEIFYPIYQVHHHSLADMQERLEQLYNRLCTVFAARKSSFKHLSSYFRHYYTQKRWLETLKAGQPLPRRQKATAEQVRLWLKWMSDGELDIPLSEVLKHIDHPNLLGTHPAREAAVRYFAASQWHLAKSLFTFRDSFQPATAVFYDPNHTFSSETINQYNLLHVLGNYHVEWYKDRQQFVSIHGQTDQKGDFYGRLGDYRQPKLQFSLIFNTRNHLPDTDQDTFERSWCCRPVALQGLELRATEKLGDLIPLNQEIAETIQNRFVPVLLLPHEGNGFSYVGTAYRVLRYSTIYGYQLTVTFADGNQARYLAYIGKDAWLAHAELNSHLQMAKKLKSTAIFI